MVFSPSPRRLTILAIQQEKASGSATKKCASQRLFFVI
jgi:hypothetical protein